MASAKSISSGCYDCFPIFFGLRDGAGTSPKSNRAEGPPSYQPSGNALGMDRPACPLRAESPNYRMGLGSILQSMIRAFSPYANEDAFYLVGRCPRLVYRRAFGPWRNVQFCPSFQSWHMADGFSDFFQV